MVGFGSADADRLTALSKLGGGEYKSCLTATELTQAFRELAASATIQVRPVTPSPYHYFLLPSPGFSPRALTTCRAGVKPPFPSPPFMHTQSWILADDAYRKVRHVHRKHG
jgi:hypothetical protein